MNDRRFHIFMNAKKSCAWMRKGVKLEFIVKVVKKFQKFKLQQFCGKIY